MTIHVQRIYDGHGSGHGPAQGKARRVLVDRVWPRGISKEDAHLDLWAKDLAPSTDLRKWFNHDPAKWPAFRERYFEELRAQPDALEELRALVRAGDVVLLFGAKDTEHNNAVALKEFLEGRAAR